MLVALIVLIWIGSLKGLPGILVKYVGTKEQLADILAKGSFTADAWNTLLNQCLIFSPESRKYISFLKPLK